METIATKVEIKRFFETSVEAVYSAWTQPEQLKKWHAPGNMSVSIAEVDLRVGGQFKIGMFDPDDENTATVTGEYVEVKTNKRLVYTWGWEGPDRYDSLVTVDFVKKGNGTEIILQHEKLASEEACNKHEHGWTRCIDKLNMLFRK